MQNITPYNSQVPNITGIPDNRATGDDFGAQVGKEIGSIGQNLGQLSDEMRAHQDRMDGVDAQLALAKARSDMTTNLIQAENSPDAGSPNFQENFLSAFDQYQGKVTDGLPNNNKVRQAFAVGMADLRAELGTKAAASQAAQGAALTTQKASDTLSTYVNTVATDPTQYDASVKSGYDLITSLNLPPDKAADLKTGFTNAAISSRFDAMFRAAKSPQAIAGIINDLETGPWKNQMGDKSFNDLLTIAKKAQLSAQTAMNAQAKAAVDGIETRITGGAPIDPNELNAVNDAVKQSNSPVLQDRWARLYTQQQATGKLNALSSSDLHDYSNANKGQLAAVPANNLTARVQDGFQYLTQKYGLSDVGALGILMNGGRETGFVPRTITDVNGLPSGGYFQWNGDRFTRAQAAGAAGPDLRRAIDFALSEPEGQQYLAMDRAGVFKTRDQAATAFLKVFEKTLNPGSDAVKNSQWGDRIVQAISGGRPLLGPSGGPAAAGARGEEVPPAAGSQYPTEFEWIRAKAADDVLKQRDSLIGQGDMISAGANAGLYQLGQLNSSSDFQQRGQQAQQAASFLGTQPKPFTPTEMAAFDNVMQSGTLDQKTALLQNVSSMGKMAPDAFKQLGEKSAVFEHIGGLATVSPGVARDVLAGVQKLQDNPDLKQELVTGTGSKGHGTAIEFASVVGNAFANQPGAAYGARQAADALYVQRQGAGAPWSSDVYDQAVRDVLGAKPGDSDGALVNVNGQQTALPPGVSGTDFQTMISRLTPVDLTEHSVGGAPPTDIHGNVMTPDDIRSEGRFNMQGLGAYTITMADNKPLAGSGPNGFYVFKIDKAGIDQINSRPVAAPVTDAPDTGPTLGAPPPVGGSSPSPLGSPSPLSFPSPVGNGQSPLSSPSPLSFPSPLGQQ